MENGMSFISNALTKVSIFAREAAEAATEKAHEGGGHVDFFIHDAVVLARNADGTPKLCLTTTHVCLFVVMLALFLLGLYTRKQFKNPTQIPKTFQNIMELIVESIDNMVKATMGHNSPKYRNYLGALLLFIAFANTSGMFGLRPPTADYGTTFGLALISFAMIQYGAIKTKKMGYLKELTSPILLTPMHIIGEIAIPVSLSLRLFGNITGGFVLMALCYGLLPMFLKVGTPAFLHIYFDIFAPLIQSYVFVMLTMTFISVKMEEEV